MSAGLDDLVDITRAPLVPDPYHADGRRDWANAVTVATDVPASVQPQSSTEETTDRQTTVTTWKVFLPAGTDVVETDRIIGPDGTALEVLGDAGRWRYGGAEHHLELTCRHITGG